MKNTKTFLSIRLLLTLIIITTLVILIFIGLRFYLTYQTTSALLIKNGEEIATRIANTATPTIWNTQRKGIDRQFSQDVVKAIVDAELQSPDVSGIRVYGTFGHMFMGAIRRPDGSISNLDPIAHQQEIDTAYRTIRKTIAYQGVTIGNVDVVLNNQRYLRSLKSSLLLELIQVGVVASLIVTFVFFALRRSLIKPLLQIQVAKSALETLDEGVMVIDTNGLLIEANTKLIVMSWRRHADIIGKKINLDEYLTSPKNDAESLLEHVKVHHHWSGDIVMRNNEKETSFPGWLVGSMIYNKNNLPAAYVLVIRDMTTLKEHQRDLERLAFNDPLTGLPNRVSFERKLSHSIAIADQANQRFAVLFVDLDNFKSVNDTLGHEAGDQLLLKMADRFQRRLRDADILARLGGDEFTVIIPQIGHDFAFGEVANDFVELANQPIIIEGRKIYSGASIGISIFPDHGTTGSDLLKHADIAMYKAKEQGRNRVILYSVEMRAKAEALVAMESDLRRAITYSMFELHYQPKVSLITGAVVGVEALIRWRTDNGELVSPLAFIPLAEERGLIIPIGNWVLQESLRQLKEWKNTEAAEISIAINLSPAQFYDKSFLKVLREEMAMDPSIAKRFQIEATESMLIKNADLSIQILSELKGLGIKISIDDFGTGYSSLSYLKRLPIDCLKVDRSFIMDIEHSLNDQSITQAVVALAQSLNLDVVVEGIERASQVDRLVAMGCVVGQGYLYSKPVPANELLSHLIKRRALCDKTQQASC